MAFGVVGTLDDIPHDVQMRASGALVPIEDPRTGASFTVSSPLQVGGQDKVPPTLAPEIGQHTVEVLRAAGIAAAEIERLLQRRGDPPGLTGSGDRRQFRAGLLTPAGTSRRALGRGGEAARTLLERFRGNRLCKRSFALSSAGLVRFQALPDTHSTLAVRRHWPRSNHRRIPA